jgi:ATP-dependent DNA helicase RecQ
MSFNVLDTAQGHPPPNCPKCGGIMVPRLARTGPNAGTQFWGCQGFPNCRGLLPLAGTASAASSDDISTIPSGSILPRAIVVEGVSPGHRAVYLDTVTMPRWLLKTIARQEDSPLAAYAWRLDLPMLVRDAADCHPGVAPAYSFLLRGAVTAASTKLVESCGLQIEASRDVAEDRRRAVPSHLTSASHIRFDDRTFDSHEECALYRELIRQSSERNLAVSITPQVGLQSLAPGSELADAGLRVDFVLATPSGERLVLEIDGEQHRESRANDARRDEVLSKAGYSVLRITASRVRTDAVAQAKQVLAQLGPTEWADEDPASRRLQQLAQIQISVIAAMRSGALPSVGCVPISVSFSNPAQEIDPGAIQSALDDVGDLLRDLALARGEIAPELALVFSTDTNASSIRFGSSTDEPEPTAIYIHDALRFAPPLVDLGSHDHPPGTRIDREAARRLFDRCYGFADFRHGQYEAIERVIRGLDTLLLLPTGAGKSATYQFATLIRGGVAIVVDPLLSLIDDQIQNLREHGVDRSVQVSSQIEPQSREELVSLLCQGHFSFVFVSPERLQQSSFREAIQIVALRRGISLIAIDEAHCVSQWGHDFRPAYLNVARTIRNHSRRASGNTPPVLAMTGTASYAVLRDIQREVGIADPDAQITPTDFDRKELRFEVIPCRTPDKSTELAKLLLGLHKRFRVQDLQSFWHRRRESPITGLVFCPHVNGDHGTAEIANAIRRALPGIPVATHSSKPPRGSQAGGWQQLKRQSASQFKRDEVQILACTNSFGMGIDKPNIRFTIHWGLPQSIESFYQEAGRAGRGRAESWCILLVSDDNPSQAEQQLAGRGMRVDVPWSSQSDIDRQLFFHHNSFPPVAGEQAQLAEFVAICMQSKLSMVEIDFGGDSDRQVRERAIYRLLLLGVALDYTVDWQKRVFLVQLDDRNPDTIIDRFSSYVHAFNAKRGRAMRGELERWRTERQATTIQLAQHAGERLIDFTYDQIEGARRRALAEMRRVAREHAGDEQGFRHGLLAYLSTSTFSAMLQAVADDPTGGLTMIPEILDRIESPLDAADLAGQAGRLLGSIYDQPGLVTTHALALLASPNPDVQAASLDLALALTSAEKFELSPIEVLSAFDGGMHQLSIPDALRSRLAEELTDAEPELSLARQHAEWMAHGTTGVMADHGIAYLARDVLRGTDQLLDTLKHVL